MKELYGRILNGNFLSPSDSEAILLDIQKKDPGSTHDAMADHISSEGKNTYQILVDELEAHFSQGRLLDLGCGSGDLVKYLDDSFLQSYSGIDLSGSEINIARKTFPHLNFVCGRAEMMPFKTESFDALLSHMFIHMISDLEGMLSEARRVLVGGGPFISLYRDSNHENEALCAIRGLVQAHIAHKYPKFKFKIGSKSQREPLALEDSVKKYGFTVRSQSSYLLKDKGDSSKVASNIARMFPIVLLPEEDQEILKKQIQQYLESSSIHIEFGFKILIIA